MNWKAILGAGAFVLAAPAAFATAPPKISGAYLLTYNGICQASYSTSPNFSITDNGNISRSVLTATFTGTTTGSFTFRETRSGGSLIIEGGDPGDMSVTTETLKGTYTVSGSSSPYTLKLKITSPAHDKGTTDYAIVFGTITGGIAQNAVFTGITGDGGPNSCAVDGSVTIIP